MYMSFTRKFVTLFVFSALGFSSPLWASMIVDNSIINFTAGESTRKDVGIKNPDQEPIYIDVEVLEIINPGAPNEERKKVTNPKEAGFLVTPDRLVVPPGTDKMIRLVNLKPTSPTERVFRVSLIPVAADIEATQTGVKILVGYQLLVLMSPAKAEPLIKSVREGKKLILTNEGNANVLLTRGQQCAGAASENEEVKDCVDLPVHRLYPGNRVEIDLKYDTPANYLSTAGASNQNVSY